MKLIGIGDNVVDYYLDLGQKFPGGNALNVAVLSKRCGMEQCSYMGIVGDDAASRHIVDSLNKEGIDISRMRYVVGPSGEARVSLNEDGDRVFVGSNKGGVQAALTLRLTDDDLAYIRTHDIVHTSIYSNLEHELHKMAGVPISFDFSTRLEPDYLKQVCPYLTYAFFSGSHLSYGQTLELTEFVGSLGVKVVGITRGGSPAIFSENGRIAEQSIVPTQVVDTLGAGDTFIAAFLTHYLESRDLSGALQAAASAAALTCRHYGAFGYGIAK